MILKIQKLHYFILDTIFPIKCISCQTEGAWICEICLSKIKIITEHVCPVCEKRIVPCGKTCHECKRKSSLDAMLPAVRYNDCFVSSAVHLFKYRFVAGLHVQLSSLLIKALQLNELPLPDLLIPIPLHPKRMRWRGFNQSFLLANYLAQHLLPTNELTVLENTLVRNRYTSPQMEIKNYQGRTQNILGAFSLTNKDAIKGKTIMLIDDVATTGSTIFECAKVLKSAGAQEVYAVVIARQQGTS